MMCHVFLWVKDKVLKAVQREACHRFLLWNFMAAVIYICPRASGPVISTLSTLEVQASPDILYKKLFILHDKKDCAFIMYRGILV